MTTTSTISQKLRNYCNVLRDAGLSYGDYLEHLPYLLFLPQQDAMPQIGTDVALRGLPSGDLGKSIAD